MTLSDGCSGATIQTPTLSSSTLSVDDGASSTLTFTDASDSFGTFLSDITFCGERNYDVQFRSGGNAGNTVSWVSVALTSGNSYTITASPVSTSTELQTTHEVKLVISAPTAYSGSQTAVEVNFDITVAEPSCNCAEMPWDPAATATSSAPV